MSETPSTTTGIGERGLARHRVELWSRRLLVTCLAGFVLLGLLGAWGPRPAGVTARGNDVDLRVDGPTRLRPGMIAQFRVTVDPRVSVRAPEIVLGPAFLERMTVNSVTPQPVAEHADGDGLVLGYDPLRAGERLAVRIQLQVNPDNRGRRDQGVSFRDDGRRLVAVERTLTVLP